MKWYKKASALLVVLTIALLSSEPLYAQTISNPDSITVTRVRTYQDVLVDGDLLVVAEYEIEYTITPSIDVSQAYVARFLDGATLVATTNVYPLVIPNLGYDEGIFSFYFDVEPTPATGFSVSLQGNPSLFPSSSGNTATNSAIEGPFTKSLLSIHLRILAQNFESVWSDSEPDIDLIERTAEGNRFTFDGEDYFANSINRLDEMVPTLFSASILSPTIQEDTFTNTYTNQLRNFWAGTSFQSSIDNLADYLSTPAIIISTAILLATAGAIAFYVLTATQKPQMALLAGEVVIIFGGLVGWTPFEFVAILGIIGVLAIGYMFFYRGSAA